MNYKTLSKGILWAVGTIVLVALFLYFLYLIKPVIVYLIIAGVLSLMGRPIVIFFRKRLKMRNTIAVFITLLLFIGIFIGIVLLFIPLIAEHSANLSLLDFETIKQNTEHLYGEVVHYFGIEQKNIANLFKDSEIWKGIEFGGITNFFNLILTGLGSFGIGLFSVLFILFFFLKDSKLLENGILTFTPSSKVKNSKHSFQAIKSMLSRYFVGLLLQITILFLIYTGVLLLFGVHNAIVIALICALLNLIPYIGPMISAFLIIVLSMSSFLGESFSDVILPKTSYIMIGFVFAQLIDNFVSQPFIFSRSTKSHPLEVFLIILIGGLLFGVVGMISAVPGYTALKVILKEFLSENDIVKKFTRNV